jgi:hypothetical protein
MCIIIGPGFYQGFFVICLLMELNDSNDENDFMIQREEILILIDISLFAFVTIKKEQDC